MEPSVPGDPATYVYMDGMSPEHLLNALKACHVYVTRHCSVENVLEAARVFTKGRVIGLFGCGGDRDRTKRPKMGAIAAKLSDYCIVTSDNPRTEKPEAIIEDILEGMKDTKTPYDVIVNRPEAIWHALDIAQTGDTIVLMGKGHETYQEINHVKHHLDEREVVAQYFENKNRK